MDDEGGRLLFCPDCLDDLYDVEETEVCDICGQCPHLCGCPEPRLKTIGVKPEICPVTKDEPCNDCGYCYEGPQLPKPSTLH